MMRHQHLQRNPWYRGYMPRSYIAPHKLASYGCSVYLIVFGIFCLLAGTIITVVSKHADSSFKKHENDPRFQDDFFKKAREEHKKQGFDHSNVTNVMKTVGVVVLCLGGVFILSAIGLCCFAKFHADKHSNRQQNVASRPLNQVGGYPPPPPGSYPQQQPPPPGSYPPPSGYPQQYAPVSGSYPQQPMMTSYPEQTAPPSAYPYPPPTQPPPSAHYVNEKNTPYPGFQGPTATNAPPVGFKEG